MRHKFKTVLFWMPILVGFHWQCTHSLKRATIHKNHTLQCYPPYEEELVSRLDSGDSLWGSYVYTEMPGFESQQLEVKKGGGFWEYYSGCGPRIIRRKVRGFWYVKDDRLVLRDRLLRKYSFIYYRHGNFLFLVPEAKSKAFKKMVEKESHRLDSISVRAPYYDRLYREMAFLKGLCYYRRPPYLGDTAVRPQELFPLLSPDSLR